MLVVRSRQERKVADVLQARGYEVFLPMHTVRRQWSDRKKIYDAPLFPCHLFCRALAKTELQVLRISGVVQIFPGRGQQLPIPDEEIERLRRLAASQYPVECSALPQIGDVVEIPGDIPIRGVLVERASVCRVAIGFAVMGSPVSSESVRKSADSFVPSSTGDAVIDRIILDRFGSGSTLCEISIDLAARFPGRFPDWKAALSRVASLSIRYAG